VPLLTTDAPPANSLTFTPDTYAAIRQMVAEGAAIGFESAAERLAVAPIKRVTVGLKGLVAMTGKSRAGIYRSMAAGKFPRPVDDGTGAARWRVRDIEEWAAKLKHKK
jgi:predicted DNA-binding transcriptional regulator AlpA